MFKNISNIENTNVFEPKNGTLNIAPIKISGQYKIVIGIDGNLYLDDYNSRRVAIDKTQAFLPQVGNFLMTKNLLENKSKLKYGGFNESNVKSYHIPLHINDRQSLPKYFVLNRVENKNFTDVNDLYSFSNIINLVDFEKIGITQIFNEILDFDCKPVFFNFEDSFIQLEGFNIVNLSKGNFTFLTSNSQSNQSYFDVFNNKIMNTFTENDLIIPNFLNIELEFYYDTTDFKFYNFFGFLSQENSATLQTYDKSKIMVNIFDYFAYTDYKQLREDIPTINIGFDDLLTTTVVKNIANQLPQTRITLSNLSAEDYIRIIHPDETVYFEYIIKSVDIKPTFNETILLLCSKLQSLSNLNLLFQPKVANNIATITIKLNSPEEESTQFRLDVPNWYKATDDTYYFKSITDKEILFLSNEEIDISKIVINNIAYQIVDKFKFNGNNIVSLDKDPNIVSQDFGQFFITKYSNLVNLKPICYYTVNSDLGSNHQFDKDLYIAELTDKYVTNRTDKDDPRYEEYLETAIKTIEIFKNSNLYSDYFQYVKEIEIPKNAYEKQTVNDGSNNIVMEPENNSENIKTMMFSDYGSTGYITPNILNIDKQFYDINGNLDYIKLDTDILRFHWFLIKSVTPEYLKNDIRSLRYFEDIPKITSKLELNADDGSFCETTFLGVKYRLPRKYTDYDFAVYLDYQNEDHIELKYQYQIDNVNRKLYLTIYKYLDFVDLLRGGNTQQTPLIDLSFFYNVQESHNTLSEALYSFRSGGVLLCDNEIPVMFNSQIINGWRYFDEITQKWYMCLKRSSSVITSLFTDLFPTSGDFEFFIYSDVTINGTKHSYVSMKFEVKNITIVGDNFVWFEDLNVQFYDTNNFFINNGGENFLEVQPENILSIVPLNQNRYSNYEAIATIIVDSANIPFKIINPVDKFSFKEYYFEFGRIVNHNPISQASTQTDFAFSFPEYYDGSNKDFDYFNNLFGNGSSFDNVTNNQIVTLFDRHQLWNLIRNILQVDVRFKHSTAKQTKKLINELLLNNLVDFSDLTSIETNTDEFIKMSVVQNDVNLVIWKHLSDITNPENKVFKINRYKGHYYPALFKVPSEMEFQIIKSVDENPKSLFNIYDENFGGKAIVATGIWSEVNNIVSSLFCKTDDLQITTKIPQELYSQDTVFNFQNLIEEKIPLSDIIINNKNIGLLSSVNNNIDEYIKESFLNYFLSNFYYISEVKNELNQKLYFEEQQNFNILLKSIKSFQTRFNNIIIIFKRK